MNLKKSKIIAFVGIVISIVVIISLLVVNSRPYLKLSKVAANPTKYDGKEIQVIGIVQGFSGGDFNLTEEGYSILIDTTDVTIPTDLENGIEVVVTGDFEVSLVLRAIQILS